MTQPTLTIPQVDAQKQLHITDEQAQFFLDNGFLVIRNVLVGEELKKIQNDMYSLYEKGISGTDLGEDYLYHKRADGSRRFWRVEYVIEKMDVMKSLLAHPFILRSVEKIQGNNFIPTWDSMVVKVPNHAAAVPWHRDAENPGGAGAKPIFNVDFYLDPADERSCLWVIPGSTHWTKEDADAYCARPGFSFEGAIPVPMNPGDVIFHDIQLLHGSPEGDGNDLRRTVYFEFRAGENEDEFGPHTLEYIPLKQQVLLDCIEYRKTQDFAADETAFEYKPTGKFAVSKLKKPDNYRYAHGEFWRK
ncbi:phytanoyl-CoA dioxygenase family protein [Paenibacillus gansuensis]|uniref:Phytanoyl-CoA dioxygenase family protein n=1 Tax=Paenibacillus gansuensis TaxID=306542 RepID=A0ABW5PF00_9BACL